MNDTTIYSADPRADDPEYRTDLMSHVKTKTSNERAEWVEDGGSISVQERLYRLLIYSAVNNQEIDAKKMRMAARFKQPKNISWPSNGLEFLQQGGMHGIEYWQAKEAAKRAIRTAQEIMLPELESFLAPGGQLLPEDIEDDGLADMTRGRIKKEVRRLRRILGLPYRQSAEDRQKKAREKTRERVRRFRARAR